MVIPLAEVQTVDIQYEYLPGHISLATEGSARVVGTATYQIELAAVPMLTVKLWQSC